MCNTYGHRKHGCLNQHVEAEDQCWFPQRSNRNSKLYMMCKKCIQAIPSSPGDAGEHTVTEKDPPQRITQRPPWGFFTLPIELRHYIYWLILQPANTRGHQLGSTKVLGLCTQTYEEATPYLKPYVPFFHLGIGYRSLFRPPKANGKPNLMESWKRTSSCYKYQRYTELEVLRAPSVQIYLDGALNRERTDLRQKVVDDVREMTRIVEKSTTLETLAIAVGAHWPEDSRIYSRLLVACKELLAACKQKSVAAHLQYERNLDDEEEEEDAAETSRRHNDGQNGTTTNPLVMYFQTTAARMSTDIQLYLLGQTPYADLEYIHEFTNYTILYRPHLFHPQSTGPSRRSTTIPTDRASNLELDPMYLHPAFYHPHPSKPYTPIPECRSCLSTFPSPATLSAHLTANPTHATPFRRKRWNPVSPLAGRGYGRVCWTCGYECAALGTLDAHFRRFKGHRRFGIVPRYVEDNWVWNRKWRVHERRFGWL